MPVSGTLRVVALTLAVASLAAPSVRAQNRTPQPVSMRELARSVAAEFLSRGTAAERDGHLTEAAALYARAVESDPGYLSAHLAAARLMVTRGWTDAALRALAAVPSRAYESDADAVQLARAAAAAGNLDGAVALLAARPPSADVARARVELYANAGRFPEALNTARQLAELTRASGDHSTDTLVRALGLLVGDADAVRAVPAAASALRRLLAE